MIVTATSNRSARESAQSKRLILQVFLQKKKGGKKEKERRQIREIEIHFICFDTSVLFLFSQPELQGLPEADRKMFHEK